jgi:hypothetical protein
VIIIAACVRLVSARPGVAAIVPLSALSYGVVGSRNNGATESAKRLCVI